MSGIEDKAQLIAGLAPQLDPQPYVFVSLPEAKAAPLLPQALGLFREAEGVTLILPADASRAGSPPMRRITLAVPSALTAVGLTEAVAAALAAENIPCNVVAAYHHDHVFVPAERAEHALACLEALQDGV